ncbi:MAG: tetratricopeptide repeat protein [Methanospirillum sp.]
MTSSGEGTPHCIYCAGKTDPKTNYCENCHRLLGSDELVFLKPDAGTKRIPQNAQGDTDGATVICSHCGLETDSKYSLCPRCKKVIRQPQRLGGTPDYSPIQASPIIQGNQDLADSPDSFHSGVAAYNEKQYEVAVRCFEAAIASDPILINAFLWEGQALFKLGKYAEAVRTYDRALRINNRTPVAWMLRGMNLLELSKYQKNNSSTLRYALLSLDKALELQQNNAAAWYYRGHVLFQMGKYSESWNNFDSSLKIEPNNPDALHYQNRCIEEMNQKNTLTPTYNPYPSQYNSSDVHPIPTHTIDPFANDPSPKNNPTYNMYLFLAVAIFVIFGGVCVAAMNSGPVTPKIPVGSVSQIKANAISVPYDQLFRDNERYVGKTVYFRGEVDQAVDDSRGNYVFRLATGKSEYVGYLGDIIWIDYQGQRYIESDVLDVWGQVVGLKKYTSIFGAEVTVPQIVALHTELVPKTK